MSVGSCSNEGEANDDCSGEAKRRPGVERGLKAQSCLWVEEPYGLGDAGETVAGLGGGRNALCSPTPPGVRVRDLAP